MTTVRVKEPEAMNVLGLFLAASLRRNLVERGRACRLSGALVVDAEGMAATATFGPGEVVVSRGVADGARAVVSGSLARLVAALARPGLGAFLRVRLRGNPLFALRVLRYLAP